MEALPDSNRIWATLSQWAGSLAFILFLTLFAQPARGANIVAEFDGSDDYLRTSANVDLANRSFTLTAWVRRGAFNDQARYFFTQGQSATANNGLYVGFSANNTFRFGFTTSQLNVSSNSFVDGSWHHWACTFDIANRVRRIYRDGVQVGTDTVATTATYQGTGNLTVGGSVFNNATNSNHWSGSLDEVKVYQRALTPEEIVATMQNKTVSSNNLVDYWPFDADTSTQFLSPVSGGPALNKFNGAFTSFEADLQSPNHVANFDGNDDRLETSVSQSYLANRSFTVMAWARQMGGPSSANRVRMIVTHGSENTPDKFLYFGLLPDNTFAFTFNVGGNELIGPVLSDFDWHHWTGTYDAATRARRIYRDGLLVASDTARGHFLGEGKIGVGSSSISGVNRNWVGAIDEVKIFEAALTPAQVRQEMDFGIRSSAPELEYWSFEQEDATGFASGIVDDTILPLTKFGGIASMPDDPFNKYNGSVRITGGNPSFTASARLDNRQFTLMAWARSTENGRDRMIFTQGTSEANRGLRFGFSSTDRFIFGFWGNELVTGSGHADANWHHWAATWNPGTGDRKIYRDGALVAGDKATSIYAGTGDLKVGHRYWKFVDQRKVAQLRAEQDETSGIIRGLARDIAALEAELAKLRKKKFPTTLSKAIRFVDNTLKNAAEIEAAEKALESAQKSKASYETKLERLQNQEDAAEATWDSSALWVWPGDLDELRIFNRALTQDEVRGEAVRFGSSGLTPDLLQGWTLDSYYNKPGILGFYSMIQGGAELVARRDIGLALRQRALAPPGIGPLPEVTINEDSASTKVAISGIYDGSPGRQENLTVKAAASEPALIPHFGMSYNGSGTTATAEFVPAPDANGDATVTVTASKTYGGLTVEGSRSFKVLVNSVNDLPVIGTTTSARLQGGTHSVSVPAVQGLPGGSEPHTVSAWVRLIGPVTQRQRLLVLGEARPGALEWTLEATGDPNQPLVRLGIWANTNDQIRIPTLPAGQWTHLASSWDGTSFRVYVNGVLSGQIVPNPARVQFDLQGVSLRLGYPFDTVVSNETGFEGNFDEVQIWNRALADSEIQSNMNRPLTGREAGILLYWRFDEGESNRATDTAAIGDSKPNPSHGAFLGRGRERRLSSLSVYGGVATSASVPVVQGLPAGGEPHTVSAWVRNSTWVVPNSTGPSLLRLGDLEGALRWRVSSDNFSGSTLAVEIGSSVRVSTPSLPNYQWTHIASTWDGTSLRVYANGALVGETAPNPDVFRVDLKGVSFRLGYPFDGLVPNEPGFSGYFDEVQIWNRALAASEIQSNMNRPLTGGEAGLLLYWRFDDATRDWNAPESPVTDTAAIGGSKLSPNHGTLRGYAYYPNFIPPGFGVGVGVARFETVVPPGFGVVAADEDKPTPIFLPGFDLDSPLNYTIVTPPRNGTLSRTGGEWANPKHNPLVYTPNRDFTGTDSFVYRFNDGFVDTPSQTVTIQVTDVNDPPIISSLKTQLIEEDAAPRPIRIRVFDPETPADSLRLAAASSDRKVIPSANIVFGGSGTNRTVTITPADGELGRSTVTLTVSDADGGSTLSTFDVEVLRHAYAVVDLGTLPNHTSSSGMAINDNGFAVGSSETSSSDSHAFLFLGLDGGAELADLGTLGGTTSQALAISRNNQVAGVSLTADRLKHGFVLTDFESAIADLGTLLGGTTSSASGINAQGVVVGTGGSLISKERAFIGRPEEAELTDIGALGGTEAQATAINDLGAVVGFSRLENGPLRAFVYEEGVMKDLGVLATNHTGSRAWAISQTGQIVGESFIDQASEAVSYQDGVMTGLGLLSTNGTSVAYGVNARGQIVGRATIGQGSSRAILFSAGQLLDLNNLIPADSGWVLTEARGINSKGEIVGTGIINGQRHAFVAMPATPIGRPLARPAGAVASRPPEVELIESNSGDAPENSFYWSSFEGRMYAIRPVTAKVNWATSAKFSDTNRITTVSINVWPKSPQLYVATSPVEVEPRGAAIAYRFQSAMYSTTTGVSVDLSTKIFRSTRTGWSVLYYLKTDGEAADPQSQHPHFEVVKRIAWDDPAYLRDQVPWTIGNVLTNAAHQDYLRKQGYAIFERAPYDGADEDRAHDRDTRLGPIIPVNVDTSAADDDLVVAWYRTNKIGVAWSTDPVRYALSWPANAPHIVIASGLGSGPLPDADFPGRRVYHQADPRLSGYNPNEEHALILPGPSGDDALFSLRNDLNRVVGVSEPFSLLKYKEPASGEWRIKVFQVVAEESPYFFQYSGVAGNEIAPPYPLSVLPLCGASYGVRGPYWKDVRGKLHAKAAGAFGADATIVARYFYPLQPGFFYDLNKNGAADAPLNDCIPWLDRLPAGQPGQPVDIRYTIRWPDDPPVLQVGETLFNPKRGLPGVRSMAKAAIVYDDVTDTIDSSKHGAQLYDPLSDRKIKLAPAESIPTGIKLQNINSKDIFTGLAFPLRVRLKYDPTNRELLFGGYLDESGIGSNPLLLPNILTSQERLSLLKLSGLPVWKQIIDRLYIATRNPNLLDVDGNGEPDNSVLAGQRLSGSTLVQEAFGSLPKALTAGFSDVPPAEPRPGSALSFTGTGQMAVPSIGPLNDFTIGVWARLATTANGFLFSDSSGGSRFSLKAERGNGKLVVMEGNTVPHDFGYDFDNQWHFFALVRDLTAGKVYLYVDGRPIGEPFAVQGAAYTGGVTVGAALNAQLEEFQVWNVARGGNAIRARMDRALNGAEDGLVVYYTFNTTILGLDSGPKRLNATVTAGERITSSTAPVGIPPRFVVLAENNDLTLGALPISLKVIRIEDGPYAGDLKVIYPDNVFDERLSFRHSNDFAGDPDQVQFEWYYKPDGANFDPSQLPSVNADGSIDNINGWIRYSKFGPGINQITIGEGGESSLLTLGDNWFICRFKGYAVGRRPTTEWSDWVGDPASVGVPAAILGEGWVKRVIRGLNPFDARVKDFHSSPVSTFSSMLVQAGQRYEGDIAFNPSAENLNRIGLIEAYQTVLNRGRSLSIEGTPAVDFSPANNALLLAASRIADLYALLGNEAYADAQDPTIAFGTKSGAYGSLASSIFAFQNQLDSMLEEELTLLRGRDTSAAGVQGAPVYNRLFWNFTLGEGEVAYQQAYNISDQNKDGFIDEKDARTLYPQGHGDAWGHYLTALTGYYDLLRHPNYTWIPRAESVLVAGTSVQVDFLDERKFAKAAALKAKAGVEILNLTYRLNYVDDPGGQWQGYKDTATDRAWGVSEWAWRAGQGAYFDWVVANAILPADDTTHPPGIQKIDRTTVAELREIPSQYDQVQTRMDQADNGLNPLGLAKGVVPFDIDPALLDAGASGGTQTQYEQVQTRALTAMANAVRVWDQANAANSLIRGNQDSVEEFSKNNDDQERDFKNRLIEIFGYPYAGDIGPGRTYPSGYDGPDFLHYMYVATKELNGETAPPSKEFTGFLKPLQKDFKSAGVLFPEDTPLGPASVNLVNDAVPIQFPVSANDYAFVAPTSWGQRRAPGQLQEALSDMVQADARLKQAIASYDKLMKDIKDMVVGLEGEGDFRADRIKILDKRNKTLRSLSEEIVSKENAVRGLRIMQGLIHDTAEEIKEGFPTVVGTATDSTSAMRAGVLIGAKLVSVGITLAADDMESQIAFSEKDKEVASNTAELEIETANVAQERVNELKQVLTKMREEPNLRLEMYNQKEALVQLTGRFQSTLANGQRILEERVAFRQRSAAETTENRYQDMTFRIFRNDALQKYRAQFDQAARYVYLAATAYDYETCLIGEDGRSGRNFLTDIIRQRSLGQMIEGKPIAGRPGLADALARMGQNFDVLKTQLGFNQPQVETGRFSLRSELMRLRNSSGDVWREELKKSRVDNLWSVPEFRRFCRPFAPEESGPQPGLVIRFPTTVTFGQNFFGWPLSGGDSAYDPSRFSTKVRSVGVWFSDYNGNGLSLTPRVYLFPVGMDVLRSPTSGDFRTREWRVVDQVLPVPFPIGPTTLKDPAWRPDEALGGSFADIRKFAGFRAFHDSGRFDESQAISESRLIGRSVWNTEWMLVIPGGTFLADQNQGLDTFIEGVSDIKIFFQTYSYAGN